MRIIHEKYKYKPQIGSEVGTSDWSRHDAEEVKNYVLQTFCYEFEQLMDTALDNVTMYLYADAITRDDVVDICRDFLKWADKTYEFIPPTK